MRVSVACLSLLFFLLIGCSQPIVEPDEGTSESTQKVLTTPTGLLASLSEADVISLVWTSLELNTASRDRSNWDVEVIRQVRGEEVAAEFEGEPAPGCWKGPTPEPNGEISYSGSYWYVRMRPKRATPVPQERTISLTEPPAIPEPFLQQALFLLELDGSRVVARKLFCVIY